MLHRNPGDVDHRVSRNLWTHHLWRRCHRLGNTGAGAAWLHGLRPDPMGACSSSSMSNRLALVVLQELL